MVGVASILLFFRFSFLGEEGELGSYPSLSLTMDGIMDTDDEMLLRYGMTMVSLSIDRSID